MIKSCNFILYVRNQEVSTQFYKQVLGMEPTLNVPGMTEFTIGERCVLGLMPEKGIKKLLGSAIQDPEQTNGIARAEIYPRVSNPEEYFIRAEMAGARVLSAIENRDWGDLAGYVSDPDGHVLVFAKPL